MTGLTRRQLLLRAVPLAIGGIGFARAAQSVDACVQPESESLRASLNYVGAATDPAVSCARCAFFSGDPAGACGSCQMLGGPVAASGHCDSFSAPS